MCTDRELKRLIASYVNYSESIANLEKIKRELASEILQEMETRKTDTFEGKKIITERLNENATKAGKQALKELYPDTIDNYLNVSCSQFVNTKACKAIQ